MSTANPLPIRRSIVNLTAVMGETERFEDTVDTHKTKKSKLCDTPLSEIVLHRNYNCWQNTPGVHIQRALYELEPVVFSPMNIRSLPKERQRKVPKVELLKFLEAVGDCDTEMDFEESRSMSDLVAPLQLANIANGRSMKDVRLEFVDWARDGRCQLTLEDNKVWLHMKARIGRKALVDDGSEAGLEHWRLVLNFSATRAKLHGVNTSLGSAATCSSYFADTNSHIVTLGLAPRLTLILWLRNALPVRRAFLWVETTQRRSARVC